jgi:hypothetical protein
MTILSENDQLREIGRFINYGCGDYVNKCWDCDRQFIGAKGARQCLGCAVKTAQELMAQNEWQSRNINDYIKVKLTDLGRLQIVKNHNELFGENAHLYPVRFPEVDDDGWSKMQHWEVMNEFGKHMWNGAPAMIETEIQFGRRSL